MRAMISQDPFLHNRSPQGGAWEGAGLWPCQWVSLQDSTPPFVAAYRLSFRMEKADTVRVHVSADERYELWLDGKKIGRGPERGDPRHWFFESYDLTLDQGEHLLVARVWALGEFAPIAQFSVRPGFLLCPENEAYWERLGTGHASWEVKKLEGYDFTSPLSAFGIGHRIMLDGRQFTWNFERGRGDGWLPAVNEHSGYSAETRNHFLPDEHLLLPASLPPMMDHQQQIGIVRHISSPPSVETHAIAFSADNHIFAEEAQWQLLLRGEAFLTIPAQTRRRVLIDLENYYCAYPELIVSNGEDAIVRVHWQESLFADTQTWDKGQRGEIENKFFTTIWQDRDGIGDTFLLDGGVGRRLESLWWSCGRYVELLIETRDQPLTIERIVFTETRYPLEMEGSFDASDARLSELTPLALRALQMCAHETYMDCPFYEQLMYAGDTRLEILLTYVLTQDERLPQKALRMFDYSRRVYGLTQSRYPSHQVQMIPPFSLWWVAMIHDHLLWRGHSNFIRSLLPGMRAVLDAFVAARDDEKGLISSPMGWNFVDWVPYWPDGVPPGGEPGKICMPINWQFVYSLMRAVDLEKAFGEHEMAARWQRFAQEIVNSLIDCTWDEQHGLFADDLLNSDGAHALFSEHSQYLAVLSGLLPETYRHTIAENLFIAKDLTQPTVYFMHYFFETCRDLNRMDMFYERLGHWFEMQALDFKTTYESADPYSNRSDCHAWAAHPLYHYFASILGIRPTSPGFGTVEIRPQLVTLKHAHGRLPHPRGEIVMEVFNENGLLHGSITLPSGVTGILKVNQQRIDLNSAVTTF